MPVVTPTRVPYRPGASVAGAVRIGVTLRSSGTRHAELIVYVGGDQTKPLPMPTTARLSRKFYERFGDEIAAELVDWFNAVDATYCADLERLNNLNFQRFEAKVERRFAETDAKVEKRLAELQSRLEERLAVNGQQLADLRVEFHEDLAVARADLIKWAFFFWVPTALAVMGLYFR